MARIFITGSADGLGLFTARTLLAQGHQVVLHARSAERLTAVQGEVRQGAMTVVGDLSDALQTRQVAEQVERIGRMDAVVHNAGVYEGRAIVPVNVVAPYVLTALIERPARLIYLSSAMHRQGRAAALSDVDWTGATASATYSDSKLFVTALAAAVARRWPEVSSHAVDPGWVPTKMGGANAPDDLRLGHQTQEWLATSEDAAARKSGGYWHHQVQAAPHPSARDVDFQEALLERLARATGVALPAG